MRREGVWAVVAGLLLIAGLFVGFVPTHSSSGENCGSPFASKVNDLRTESSYAKLGSAANGDTGDLGYGDAAAECESKQNGTRPVAILLVVLGAVGLIAAGVSYGYAGSRDTPEAQQPASD